MENIYLDWAATAIPNSKILELMYETAQNVYGNCSSQHKIGLEASDLLEKSRNLIAGAVQTKPKHIIFTSGGTESNNLVLNSVIQKRKAGQIIIGPTEHAAVFEPAKTLANMGMPLQVIPSDQNGTINLKKLKNCITQNTSIISVMYVNNETGIIQPIEEIIEIVRNEEKKFGHSIHIHTDAVQALGKIPFSLKKLDVDSASFSAHKIGGPKGCGALFLKKSLYTIFTGGGQERGIRPGTENLPGIYAFAKASETVTQNISKNYKKAQEIISYLKNRLFEVGATCILPKERKNSEIGFSPYILNVSFSPVPGEVLQRVLNDNGIFVSTGSACSSNKKKKTRVLEMHNFSKKDIESAIRISIGPSTTKTDIDTFVNTIKKELPILKSVAY